MPQHTNISIQGAQFLINGQLTYAGRVWQGKRIEGLLINTRMVQGIFDDLNPETKHQWAYADTGTWDADRNTREFIEAMPSWLRHGVLAFTLNLQGGSPYGYSETQPWINSAINPDGSLRDDYLVRLKKILDRADELGMVVILGIFYFGQEKVLESEAAIQQAVINITQWLLDRGYTNVLIEVNNECNRRSMADFAINAFIGSSTKKRARGPYIFSGGASGVDPLVLHSLKNSRKFPHRAACRALHARLISGWDKR
ncbi:MAG: hypothetical protein AAF267_20975, partial [Deinococcota bacterium]